MQNSAHVKKMTITSAAAFMKPKDYLVDRYREKQSEKKQKMVKIYF